MTTKSMQGIFRDLNENRRKHNAATASATASYAVHFVKKDGTPYAKPVERDGLFAEQDAAERRAQALEAMNPGCKCVVLPR